MGLYYSNKIRNNPDLMLCVFICTIRGNQVIIWQSISSSSFF
jgi:hypothetical protein